MSLMFQPLARYADFNGRARRTEYWLWALFLFLANTALTILQYASVGFAAGSGDSKAAGAAGAMMIVVLIKLVFALAMLIPTIAVGVRRMHDINRTGWWIMFPTGVMLISAIVVFTLTGAEWATAIQNMKDVDESNPAAAIGQIMTVLRPFLWVFLLTFLAKIVTFVFRVTDGTPGPNRFGPDPKSRGVSNVF